MFIRFMALIKIRYDKGGTSWWMWGIFICEHIYFHPLMMVHSNEYSGIEYFVESTEECCHRKERFMLRNRVIDSFVENTEVYYHRKKKMISLWHHYDDYIFTMTSFGNITVSRQERKSASTHAAALLRSENKSIPCWRRDNIADLLHILLCVRRRS